MSKSRLEAQFLLAWRCLAPEQPLPEREYHFAREALGREFRFDFCWPAARVAVEIDGGQRAPGGGRHNTDDDRGKLNAAAVLGWHVLRFSGTMLRDPTRVVRVVLDALREGANGRA